MYLLLRYYNMSSSISRSSHCRVYNKYLLRILNLSGAHFTHVLDCWLAKNFNGRFHHHIGKLIYISSDFKPFDQFQYKMSSLFLSITHLFL